MQQGGSPTPFDRNMATKQAAKAVEWIVDVLKKSTKEDGSSYAVGPDSAVMMGIIKRRYQFTPLEQLKEETNFEWEIWKHLMSVGDSRSRH